MTRIGGVIAAAIEAETVAGSVRCHRSGLGWLA